MSDACESCLRHAHLVGRLAPQIAAALARRPARDTRPPAPLLALADEDLIAAICRADARRRAALAFLDRFDPEAARAALAEVGVEAVCRHSRRYPPVLEDLDDPPAALFVVGGAERLADIAERRLVAVVGTRRASQYGLDMARELGRGLAAAGVGVVSGLALGIDAAAHRGTLSVPGASAVAILARGPELPYPERHAALYRRLCEAGCVVSELPPGVGVQRWSFPARNRIMAALGEATVVVEAADPSGSLITARFAAQLGRLVAAVPGRATASGAAGSNGLIRDGAHVVLRPADVLDLVLGVRDHPQPPAEQPRLDGTLAVVLEAVEACDVVPEIGARTRLPPGDVRAALARLETLGLVARDDLGAYRRTPA